MRTLIVVLCVCVLASFVGWIASDSQLVACYVGLGAIVLIALVLHVIRYVAYKISEFLINIVGGS